MFSFGSTAAARGPTAVREAVVALFSTRYALEHTIACAGESGAMVVYEARVHYVFRDGTTSSVPYANVLRLAGDLVADYRIYLDPALLHAASTGDAA